MITQSSQGRTISPAFQKFVDRYYIPFAEEAIRYFYSLGFVPWSVRTRLPHPPKRDLDNE